MCNTGVMFEIEAERISRILEVGWLLDPVKSQFIWEGPRRYRAPRLENASAKAVSACPAVLQHEARLFEIPCPIDVSIKAVVADGQVQFENLNPERSGISTDYLQNLFMLMPADQWRQPNVPLIQMHTPYRFIADEECYLNALPPFHDYKSDRWPGVVVGGRFQLDVWPRKLMWAFEWHDVSKPLVLKRGEPWFYVRVDGLDPVRSCRLVEAQWTDELRRYVDGLEEVSNYVNKTLSLFKTAQSRRPQSLLKTRRRA